MMARSCLFEAISVDVCIPGFGAEGSPIVSGYFLWGFLKGQIALLGGC